MAQRSLDSSGRWPDEHGPVVPATSTDAAASPEAQHLLGRIAAGLSRFPRSPPAQRSGCLAIAAIFRSLSHPGRPIDAASGVSRRISQAAVVAAVWALAKHGAPPPPRGSLGT